MSDVLHVLVVVRPEAFPSLEGLSRSERIKVTKEFYRERLDVLLRKIPTENIVAVLPRLGRLAVQGMTEEEVLQLSQGADFTVSCLPDALLKQGIGNVDG